MQHSQCGSLLSRFLTTQTVHHVQEGGGQVFLIFVVAKDDTVLTVVAWRGVEREVIKFFQEELSVFDSSFLEWLHSMRGLIFEKVQDLSAVSLVVGEVFFLSKGGLLVVMALNQVINFLYSWASLSCTSFFFLVFATKGITTAHIHFVFAFHNQSAFNSNDYLLEQFFKFVGIRKNFFPSEGIQVDDHLFNNVVIITLALMNKISQRRLPKEKHSRDQLKAQLNSYLSEITLRPNPSLDVIHLRLRLIDACKQLSIERVGNLQKIFLHYCTHIFKTGKYMTFQRLQYEKSHLTIDRFFVFLKDFNLLVADINGEQKEVFQKAEVIKIFKKVSSNAKDINFEQFIACLEQIAVAYYDAKTAYNQRIKQAQQLRKIRWQNYLKSVAKKKLRQRANLGLKEEGKEEKEEEKEEGKEEKEEEKEEGKEEKEEEKEQGKGEKEGKEGKEEKQQVGQPFVPLGQAQGQNIDGKEQENNDKFIEQMMQDIGVKDFNGEMEAILQETVPRVPQQTKDCLLALTIEEKVEYFYQLISVDNANSFKKKMSELNLPIFTIGRGVCHPKKKRRAISEVGLQPQEFSLPYESARLSEIHEKIEQRKQKQLESTPQLSKEDYEKRKKKREEYVEASGTAKEGISPRKVVRRKLIEVDDIEADLSAISQMEFENINFQKFNPAKLYSANDDDDVFMQEYELRKGAARKVVAGLPSSERTAQLLERIRKRAKEVEEVERKEEKSILWGEGAARRNKIAAKFRMPPK